MFLITRVNFSNHILSTLQTTEFRPEESHTAFAFDKAMSPSGGGFCYYSWGTLNIFPSFKTVTEQFKIEPGSYQLYVQFLVQSININPNKTAIFNQKWLRTGAIFSGLFNFNIAYIQNI